MKQLLKTEEAAQLILCLFFLYDLDASWWWYLLLVLGPDIGMLGYLAGNRAGAVTYNLVHHKGVACGLILAGYLVSSFDLLFTGIILFGHSSMDRMFGYDLKTFDGFSYSHLGKIGKQKL